MNPIASAETADNTQRENDKPLLRFEHVVKQFGGTLAVNDVTLDVFSHEVLALLGGNGAGKSTLIKMLAGVHAPTSGQIFFRGRPVSHFGGKPPIAFIHQDLGLIEWMTVAENLAFGLGFPSRGGLIRWNDVSQQAEEALARVGGGISPSTRIPNLSVRAEDDIVAKAKAYVQQATARSDKWNGPTIGPKAQPSKAIICVSSDSRNGGVKGVADGLAEAAKAIGWNFRVIDGRGEVEGRGQALGQAIALKTAGDCN
jgi:ABC-type sugar transport system ATPase subunit